MIPGKSTQTTMMRRGAWQWSRPLTYAMLAASIVTMFPVRGRASDAISREVSVYNNLTFPSLVTDAVAREVSVFNNLNPTPAVLDAVSREVSVENVFLCKGNMTDDGLVTTDDIAAFVDVLTGVIADPFLRQAADVNCDGTPDGKDIQPFVKCMLGGPCP